MRLSGKKVVVVGGGSGIGLAVSKMAQREGASIVILGRSQGKLDQAKALIGEGTQTLSVDVMNEEAVAKAFAEMGDFDHLFISAQDASTATLAETTREKLGMTIDSKIWGAIHVVRQAVSKLSAQGSITFISGLASRRGYPGFAVAGAANAGIEALARNLAVELSPIRVNIDTEMLDKVFGEGKNEVVESIAEKLPVKRIGKPEEVADAVIFLMNNGFATGTTLLLDGGDALV
jgi:NAD(P)-dependent dehydrogenase (short-subunit alcohol dehydrogenase family)